MFLKRLVYIIQLHKTKPTILFNELWILALSILRFITYPEYAMSIKIGCRRTSVTNSPNQDTKLKGFIIGILPDMADLAAPALSDVAPSRRCLLSWMCRYYGRTKACGWSSPLSTLRSCGTPKSLFLIWPPSTVVCQSIISITWWRNGMKTLSTVLALSGGNLPVTGGFQAQRLYNADIRRFVGLLDDQAFGETADWPVQWDAPALMWRQHMWNFDVWSFVFCTIHSSQSSWYSKNDVYTIIQWYNETDFRLLFDTLHIT